MVQEHTGAGISHDFFHIGAHFLGIAVYLAGTAESLCLHEWAAVCSGPSVFLEFLAVGTELITFGVVIAMTVDSDHLTQSFFLHFPARFGVVQRLLDIDFHL